MNIQRLLAVAHSLKQELDKTSLPGLVSTLATNFQRVSQQAGQGQQQQVDQAYKHFQTATTGVESDNFTPAWRQILDEIGASPFLGRELQSTVAEIVSSNKMTPGMAHEKIAILAQGVTKVKNGIDQILQAADNLKLEKDSLEPGGCEIGILIPRKAVNSDLKELADEFKEMNLILETFSEIVGAKQGVQEVREISSSDYLVYVTAVSTVAVLVSTVIEKIISSYKNFLDIRKNYSELVDKSVPEEALKPLEAHVNTRMREELEKIANEIFKEYCQVKEAGRRNELANAFQICLNKIANRIDQGYNFEVRVKALPEPKKGEEDSSLPERQLLQNIEKKTAGLTFMKIEGNPILALPEKTGPNATEEPKKKKKPKK